MYSDYAYSELFYLLYGEKIWHLEFFDFFFNFGWDDLVDGWKEGRMNGRMVPRRIMVFVFRLCLLGIILPSLWRENLTLRIFRFFFQLWMRWLGRWLERRKDEWKDGTKTDNGICIQTMPTRNYFTFSMERKSDT